MGKGGGSSVAGSQVSSLPSDSSSNGAALLRHGHEDDLEERAWSDGIMGLLYTVCKEKAKYGYLFVLFRLLADWLQLWLLVVQAYWYNIDDTQLWWRVVNFIQLNQFMSARGYTFFLGAFYILVIGLAVSVAISVWVGWSFHANRFDHVWPIVFLRWFAKIFYQVLDVATMTLFLMALDCQYFGVPSAVRYQSQQFPDVYCWGMPHLIHVGVAVVCLCVFVVLAGAFVMGEMELSITTHNPLAIMHTSAELESFILRVLMTFASVFIPSWRWVSVVQLVLSARLTFIITWFQPHVCGWVNHVRSGTYMSVFWCAVVFVCRAFSLGVDLKDDQAIMDNRDMLTIVMWATFVPAGLVGALLSWLRLRYFQVTVINRFRAAPRDTPYHKIYEATDSRQVEVLMRCCRVWVDKDVLDPKAVALAERVVLLGLSQLPNDPFMIVLYSSFLIDVQSSYHSGYSQLQATKKSDASFLMRFAIFSREQQHIQKSAGGGGSSQPTDLVSYVEFQRNYNQVLKSHRDALTTMRHFWGCMMTRTIKFQSLADAVRSMDVAVRHAERVYKQVLGRHAGSVKIVRLYAKFLEHVKHDPWSAAHWFAEAERLEQQEEENKNQDAFNGMEMATPELRAMFTSLGGAVGDGRAVVIINAQGLIQMTNHVTLEMFGYSKMEVQGRNISMLMPPPFAGAHTGFLRRYIATGHTCVLNRTLPQLGLHKDRRTLPLMISVARVSGIGEDTMLMGVMELAKPAEGTARIWVSDSGSIMSLDEQASDWLAYRPSDLAGTPVNAIVVQRQKALGEALKQARASIVFSQQMQRKERVTSLGGHMSVNGTAFSPQPSAARLLSGQFLHAEELAGPKRLTSNTLEIVHDDPDRHEWVAHHVLLGHKYADPVEVRISISNAGAGAMQFHVLTLSKSGAAAATAAAATPPTELGEAHAAEHGHIQGSHHRGGSPHTRRTSVVFTDPVTWPPSQELMVVSDSSGRILHITAALAGRLGTNLAAASAGDMAGAMEGLITEPFAQLHSPQAIAFPTHTPPPYSCRAGLSVLLQGVGHQGRRQSLPFRLAIKRQPGNGLEDGYNVTTMQQCTMGFALNERRLSVEVDVASGRIVNASNTPSTLFGFDPVQVMGTSISSILDIFKEDTSLVGTDLLSRHHKGMKAAASLKHTSNPSSLGADSQTAVTRQASRGESSSHLYTPSHSGLLHMPPGAIGEGVESLRDFGAQSHKADSADIPQAGDMDVTLRLVELAERMGEGVYWRVGVCTPVDEVEMALTSGLRPLSRTTKPLFKPAIMQVKRVASSTSKGAAQGGVLLELELWRADLCCSVLELDSAGNITAPVDPALTTLYPPGLVLGAPESELVDHHVSTYLPALRTTPLSGLFVAGTFGPPPAAPGTRRVHDAPKMRSTLKQKDAIPPEQAKVGPLQTMRVRHRGDGEEVEVSIQAARKPGGGMYLVLHPVAPKQASPTFWSQCAMPPALDAEDDDAGGPLRLASFSQTATLPVMPAAEVAPRANRRGSVQWGEQETGATHAAANAATLLPRASSAGDDDLQSPSKKPKHVKANANVAAWLAGQTSGGLAVSPAAEDEDGADRPSDSGEEDDTPDDHDSALDEGDEQEAAVESVADAEGVTDGDYNRAQRFKKLHRMLASSIVQKPIARLKRHAAAVMIGLTLVHLGMFVVMFQGIEKLKKEANGLELIGKAAISSTDVAVMSRALNVLYSNMNVSTLRLIRGPEDLPVLKMVLQTKIQQFVEAHSNVYLGSPENNAIPDKYGLGYLWSMNSVNVSLISDISVNQSLNNFSTMYYHNAPTLVSLYEAGNLLSAKASSLLQRADLINASLTDASDFGGAVEMQFIALNAPKVFDGYMTSLDSYVQVVIDTAKLVNQVQLILLALEGCALCVVCTAWVWHLLSDVAHLRYSMMAVFTAVPVGLVRRLATQKHRLSDDDQNDDDDDDMNPKLLHDSKQSGQQHTATHGTHSQSQQKTAVQSIKLFVKGADDVESGNNPGAKPQGLKAWLCCCLPSMRRVGAERNKKRKLAASLHTSLWLVWPFVAWGVLVIAADGVGYYLLGTVTVPIALFNMCNSVAITYSSNNFFLQELVFEQDPSKMDGHRRGMQRRVLDLKKDFEVMLYSSKAAPQETAPQYTLVTKGVVDSGAGTNIMFGVNQCLCINPDDCLPPDHVLFPYTMNGLERMVIRYIEMGHYIPQFQYLDPYINGPEYNFYWNTQPDMFGGFTRLVDEYHGFVNSNLERVLTVHIVILVLVVLLCVTYLGAMLLPFIRSTSHETRRIAELLSQLPQEVDMDALLARTLLADLGVSTGDHTQQGGPPGAQQAGGKFAKLRDNNSSLARGSVKGI